MAEPSEIVSDAEYVSSEFFRDLVGARLQRVLVHALKTQDAAPIAESLAKAVLESKQNVGNPMKELATKYLASVKAAGKE